MVAIIDVIQLPPKFEKKKCILILVVSTRGRRGRDKLLSHNVVSSTPRLSGIRTHNVSGDRH
jgi:hypothetical protein